jgi:NADH-quinone oxidoreductase subunit L
MEGPTPVSALIHAATMVAAGVYLVGRCFPMFAPEVLLMIAYVGAITLFISATIALVQTDIKRVLAYSTCSQLGYMMLALGVGGWVAGLLHLLTHAFFKALLFLCSGSVIHGCHHEQDLRKMGGLAAKMKITAFTMLVGVLAIVGTPFFSGWYSKDLIIQTALGFGLEHPKHIMLFVLPLLTAAMTGFYMFRLWFLAFAGKPRDGEVFLHAHESPWVMTAPLIFLAVCSVGIAWGWPVWEVDASFLGHILEKGEPASVELEFNKSIHKAHEHHMLAGLLALAAAASGVGLACVMYWKPMVKPESLRAKSGPVYDFLLNKWYFDEAYDAAVVNPAVGLARASAAVDKRPTENAHGEPLPTRRFDPFTLDGWLNALGQFAGSVGRSFRAVQTGQLRTYVLVLALTAVVLLAILTASSG